MSPLIRAARSASESTVPPLEVLMATGSIGSPSLLQRSGIGSAHHLESLGIEVQCDSPGV
ncbi:MAG TPA: alanine-phosphoribitol ligase, partial [Dehalococcoidia bacterium]|nr:alanine-phosphoribitol ligase [Dehalococcoidia bacterium]